MTDTPRIHLWSLVAAIGLTLAIGIGSLAGWLPGMFASIASGDVDPVVGGGDFEMFWAASVLGAEGRWDVAYDLEGLAEAMDAPLDTVSFAYPPPFALALRPLSDLTYPTALGIWLALGIGAALVVLAAGGRRGVLGVAAMLFSLYVGLRFGQLSPLAMLWAFLGGLAIQRDRLFLAGALFGLLVLKPQLSRAVPGCRC